ncbi:hypothetical protein [Seonamhaeicola marinus]|uniref:Carboxypeptidase regulatory-like domain-containing protein n=1 Tax=Seonamhaeicola marinus TaxID=1912246 RepID=A0A5D0HX90_9FLAO|nr:hypothetical protein [Seonamhaeicola marinus]TYA74062.1 hypothetical protein FUA24_11995 [Seonamhaeicola marinus]
MLTVNAQKENLNSNYDKNAYGEKVYIQLNNTFFNNQETIWFKVIVTSTFNHSLTDLSGIAYVELIDFDKKLISKKKIKLNNGIGEGFFSLTETLPEGRYLIRAYTKWDLNFDEDFIFKQYINIYGSRLKEKKEAIRDISISQTPLEDLHISANIFPRVLKADYKRAITVFLYTKERIDSVEIKPKKGNYKLNYTLSEDATNVKLKVKLKDTKLKNYNTKEESTFSKTIALNKEFLDLQFFPEGGKLITGLRSKVGFKSINYTGQGQKVSGIIVDNNDELITSFSSNKLGMGYMFLKPSHEKQYYGKVIGKDNVVYKYPLPKVELKGFVLNVVENNSFLRLDVSSNVENADSLSLKVKSRGRLLHGHTFKLQHKSYKVLIEKSRLPSGILKITLNHKGVPACERLFFNSVSNDFLRVSAETDYTSYNPRNKTNLTISVTDAKGQPVKASLSALIKEKQYESSQSNILSYFLLNSELRGAVEKPNHYFNDTNIYARRDLEALMLTQGWRNYIYHKNETKYAFNIKPETDLLVSGAIRRRINDKKIPNKPVDLTMLTFGKPKSVHTNTTDSLGRFSFNLSNQYADKLNFVIQTTDKKGIAKDYNIILDKTFKAPEIVYEEMENIQLPDSIIKPILDKITEKERTENAFNLSNNTIELDEVELTGYNLTPVREKVMKLYGKPDVVIDGKEMEEKEEGWMYGIYSILRFRYPDDIEIKSVFSSSLGSFDIAKVKEIYGFTFILIDGIPVKFHDYPSIPNIAPDQIKSFEIIKSTKRACALSQEVFGDCPPPCPPRKNPCTHAVINIITYSGKGFYGLTSSKGIFKGVLEGFSTKREFYAPKYDKIKDEDWEVPDVRSTVYWSPLLHTDTTGKSNIEFYNGDNIGDMKVIIEAITPDGKLGYFETKYTVEENLEK